MKKLIVFSLPCIIMANSITFEEALDKTLNNNKELKAKQLEVEKAKQGLKEAVGYNYGTLTLSETIARTNNALNVFGMKLMAREATFKDFGFSDFLGGVGMALQNSSDFDAFKAQMTNPQMAAQLLNTAPDDLNNPEARTNYETKAVYEVPLFTGYKLSNAKAMAMLQVKANEAKYNFDKKKLALEVLKAYNGAVAAKYFIKATQKAKTATTSFVEFATEMYKEGLVTAIDVKQAKVYDLGVNAKLQEAQNKYNLALAYLRFLTDDKTITDVGEFKNIKLPSDNLAELQEIAIKNRDDLKYMEYNLKTMKKKISLDSAEKYPMVGAHVEYGFNDDKINNIDTDKDYYLLAVGLNYKAFDGNILKSKIEKAKLDYKKIQHYYDYMTNGIKLEVEKDYLTLNAKREVLAQKLKAKDLADEVLTQSEEMYKNSLINMTNLLQQQANAQKAEAEAIFSKYEETIAVAKLKLAIGKSLKDEK